MIEGCDERYLVWRQHIVGAARKEHRCDECGRTIGPGETYRKFVGLNPDDREWDVYHVCQHCGIACDWLVKTCNGFVHTMVMEDIEEHAKEYFHFGLYRLVAGSKRKWKRKNGGLMAIPKMPAPITVEH